MAQRQPAEVGGPDGPSPPEGPANLVVLLVWARGELLRTVRRARRARKRVIGLLAALIAIAAIAVALGVAVDEPVFWSSLGAVFVAALAAVIAYATRELGVAGNDAKSVAEHLLPEPDVSREGIEREATARAMEALAEEIYGKTALVDLRADRYSEEVAVELKQAYADEAAKLFERAAKSGRTRSMCNLARIHADRGDQAEAEAWYERAVRAGDAYGAYRLGALHAVKETSAHPRDWWLRRAAEGDAAAAYVVGREDGRLGELRHEDEPPWGT